MESLVQAFLQTLLGELRNQSKKNASRIEKPTNIIKNKFVSAKGKEVMLTVCKITQWTFSCYCLKHCIYIYIYIK